VPIGNDPVSTFEAQGATSFGAQRQLIAQLQDPETERDEEELRPEAEWERALEPIEETPEKRWVCPGCVRPGEKGPLDEPTAETFEWYLPYKLERRSTFYRQWGPPAKLTGSRGGTYYSFFPPAGSEDFMRDQMSLPPKWNSMKNTTEVTFPAGTVVYIGPAAANGGYSGGGIQVFVPNP